MLKGRTMKTPAGLTPRGRGAAFYRTATERFDFRPDELELLLETCRQLDLCEKLHGILAKEGPRLGDRVHPCAVELRLARDLLRKMTAQLAIPDGDPEDADAAMSPRSRKAQRAAQTRWNRVKGGD